MKKLPTGIRTINDGKRIIVYTRDEYEQMTNEQPDKNLRRLVILSIALAIFVVVQQIIILI